MPETKRPLKVFLCHARADKQKVRELYRYLRRRGIKPWFDEVALVGGQDWQVEIPKALATSDAIIICLTKNSVDKEGYIQKEIKFALDKALEMPEGRIFIIPVKFEECEVPFSLSRYQWVDLFDEAGYTKMMRALKFRASQLRRTDIEVPSQPPKPEQEAAEKAAREQAKREAAREKVKREGAERTMREKAERQVARKAAITTALANFFATLKSMFSPALPFLRIIGIVGIVIILFWVGSWTIPKLFSRVPTAFASATQSLTATITVTPSATPTKTLTPTPTPLPTEIIDAKGVPMALIPAGEFIMGSENGEPDEQPVHTVYLDAYYIDIYEVTNALYKACVDIGFCDPPKSSQTLRRSSYYGNSEFDNYPVINVDWDMAKTYCEWRGAQLPTEAQWEKAARSTDGRTYPWGEEIDCSKANYDDSANSDNCKGDTTQVGSYESGISPYGLYDMAGNVLEWVSSLDQPYPYSPVDGREDLTASGNRVMHGGAWNFDEYSVRASNRGSFDPSYFVVNVGFRCSRSP